jgi:hypothetical protein
MAENHATVETNVFDKFKVGTNCGVFLAKEE